ncbi:rho GTPase-activating protein 25 isoform X1 [Phascolarctos cinereus]|uniref:Rho GTPase-activating protein 25 isoform X1 n=2 Tax=Phascolarctos cinereus TaxID=38626 RepID=A0A6P5K8S9_PHACI|nr:rho GTPase-activating protein 25 isoform X1 [Phascolarctos cinereus]
MSLKLPRNWEFSLRAEAGKIARSRSVMTGEQMASFHQPSPPNTLERPLKVGWLKKQRSIVKNWQQRYFVLKGQQLYYYKDEEDVKPQGSMYLPGSTIKEIATNPEEAGKFVFEVIPASWDQNRTGQDSYVLMASSQSEMEEWVKSIRRVTGAPSGVVFGQRLDETVAYEQKFGHYSVPILVEKCMEFIREHGLNEEGIFRLPGQDNLVKKLRDAFDAGERPSFERDTDVHTVASLLKLYLRELPDPVVPWSQYEGFLLCGKLMNADESKAHQELMKQISNLPRDNYNLLSYICRFLHEIQLNSAINKMCVDNLATVIGVNIIRPKVEDPAVIMTGTLQIQRVMTMMIRDHEVLFPKSKDIPPSPPAQKHDSKKSPVPRSSVGWDAAEDSSTPRADSFNQMTSDADSSSPTGLKAADGPLELETGEVAKEQSGSWKLQSRKRTQTLPNRKCFLTSALSNSNSKVEIFNTEFWSPSPEGKTSGHKRTQSQDLHRFADSEQTSTCKSVLPGLSSSGDKPSPPDSQPASTPNSLTSLSPEEKESAQENQESLQKAILELKKEMEAQSQAYEERIKSLEKENYDVWAKVVRLNEELEQEKKKLAELEISFQNMERSRQDMEKRNKVLEEELKECATLRLAKEPSSNA